MKVLRFVLFIGFILLLSFGRAFADDLKEEKRQYIKKIISAGYTIGTIVKSGKSCDEIASRAKNQFIDEWGNDAEIANNLAKNSCLQGYQDKRNGEYTLPIILRLVDIILDSQ